jgi:hypothetical protein
LLSASAKAKYIGIITKIRDELGPEKLTQRWHQTREAILDQTARNTIEFLYETIKQRYPIDVIPQIELDYIRAEIASLLEQIERS